MCLTRKTLFSLNKTNANHRWPIGAMGLDEINCPYYSNPMFSRPEDTHHWARLLFKMASGPDFVRRTAGIPREHHSSGKGFPSSKEPVRPNHFERCGTRKSLLLLPNTDLQQLKYSTMNLMTISKPAFRNPPWQPLWSSGLRATHSSSPSRSLVSTPSIGLPPR